MKKFNSKPIVKAHPETGDIVTYFTSEAGDDYGRIRVDQTLPVIRNGFMRFANRTAFITLEKEQAEMFESMLSADKPYPFEGRVRVVESTTPFYEGQEPKTRGEDGDVITHGGLPIYRDTQFVMANDPDYDDVLLASDTAEDIIRMHEEDDVPE